MELLMNKTQASKIFGGKSNNGLLGKRKENGPPQ